MRRNKGFTLIEMIITLTLTAVIGVVLMVVLVNSLSLQTTQSARVMQGLGINTALSDINSWVRRASGVSVGYPAVTPYTYTTGVNSLVLKVPSIDGAGAVINDVYDYVVFVVESSKLKEIIFPNALSARRQSNKILTDNVALVNFSFQNTVGQSVAPSSASVVTVTINLSQKASYANEENAGTSKMRLRNF